MSHIISVPTWKSTNVPFWHAYLSYREERTEAVDLLNNQLAQVKQLERIDLIIESQILLALAFQREGKTALAIDALGNALTLAKPSDYIRVFLDEGKPLYRLLCQVASRDIHPDYVTKLLKTFEGTRFY